MLEKDLGQMVLWKGIRLNDFILEKDFLANKLNDFMLEKDLGKWFYRKKFD
jgi:hypothetical protein